MSTKNTNSPQFAKSVLNKAVSGDKKAFGFLYDLYFTPVFRYIYLRTKNKEEAEDLAQSVFLKAYKSIQNFEDTGKSPLAYFFTIARNTVIDFWRKKKDLLFGDDETVMANIPDIAPSPHELSERKDTILGLREALRTLTDEQQEVIILKFINELSNKEIADILDKTEESIRQLQFRALKALRDYCKNSQYI